VGVWKDAKVVLTDSILRLFDRLIAQDKQTRMSGLTVGTIPVDSHDDSPYPYDVIRQVIIAYK
jgi:hypothetical protein